MKIKSLWIGLAFLCLNIKSYSQTHKLSKIWETPDSIINMPESVLSNGKYLYVSEMVNSATEKDGKGNIIKMDLKGNIINKTFSGGMNAPKGLAIFGTRLYAADLDQIVEIDLKNGKILNKYPVEGAVFLNDVTVDNSGAVYVSDTRTGKIHVMVNGIVSTFLENVSKPNGLKYSGKYLYVAAGQNLLKVDN